MKLKLNVGLTALGAVLLGLAAQAQNPATPADHGGNASTQTYPQGAPALRPDSLNNPNSTTNRGDKPNMTRKERRALRRNRDTNRMERTGSRTGTNQNARTNQGSANMTTYPMEGGNTGTTQSDVGTPMKSTDATGTTNSNAGNQNGNTGINTLGTATTGYTDTTSTTSPSRNMNTGTSTATGNASSNAGNQNGQTGINSQGTSTSGYTGSGTGTVNSGSSNSGTMNSGTSTGTGNTNKASGTNSGKAGNVASNIPNMRTMSITDFASASPDYTTLVNALQTTEMTDMLQGTGQFTVFAPSNSAFNKLPAKTRSNLLGGQNRETLKQLMSYHVVEGVLDSKEIARRMNEGNGKARLQTMTGGTLVVEMGTNGRLKLTDDQGGVAYVEAPDKVQSNGVVHGVDKVLLPKGIMARFK